MNRPAKVTQPVAAKRNTRTEASAPTKPAMEFLVFEDNAGGYHWTIVADSGQTLVQSASFATCEQAKHAARIVHAGAGSASLEYLTRETPPAVRNTPPPEHVASPNSSLAARRGWHETTPVAPHGLDVERSLDEGGSSNGKAVTR